MSLDSCKTDEQKEEYKRQMKAKEIEQKRAIALCEELTMTKEDRNVQKKRE